MELWEHQCLAGFKTKRAVFRIVYFCVQGHWPRANNSLTAANAGLECRSLDEPCYCQHQIDAEARPVGAQGSRLRFGDHRLNHSNEILQPIAKKRRWVFCLPACRPPANNIMKTETTNSNETSELNPGTRTDAPDHQSAPLWLVVAAFAAVYTLWGSTYLGIRFAVQSIPPFMMAGGRHLAAGIVLFAFARLRGVVAPTWPQWRDAIIAGILMLVIGNGGVTWAEQRVPSSTAALLVALTPLWMVLLDWLRPGGVRPRALVGSGLFVGIIGVAVLARGPGEHHEAGYGWSVVALMTAAFSWAYGSVFNRTARKPASPFLGVAMQMIAGGAILFGVAATQGEFGQFHADRITAVSFGSWLYLTVAGSLVGYTAYIWLLHESTPARVATYAYVNPLIAVLLGCTLGHEVFSHELIVAGVLIIVAVVLIVRGGAQTKVKTVAAPEAPTISVSE
jgi:drug/metabolite transporter (DMT)-like permease